MESGSLTWFEVADRHPAARTTVTCKCDGSDPGAAVSVVLERSVTLEPLTVYTGDRFVRDGGWSVWRVSSPEGSAGRWVYTRPTEPEPVTWQPVTWRECVERYEEHTRGSLVPGAGWWERFERDRAVAVRMTNALGTTDHMNPVVTSDRGIGRDVFKATIVNAVAAHRGEVSNTGVGSRVLPAVLTETDLTRATGRLAGRCFAELAEWWLYRQAESGAGLDETDRLELQLLATVRDGGFLRLAGCCVFVAMCELDLEAAALWYGTGGDCSGHGDIEAYAVESREHLLAPLPVRRRPGTDTAGDSDDSTVRLSRCGAPTLTGSVCRHKVSAKTERCPAGHEQRPHRREPDPHPFEAAGPAGSSVPNGDA